VIALPGKRRALTRGVLRPDHRQRAAGGALAGAGQSIDNQDAKALLREREGSRRANDASADYDGVNGRVRHGRGFSIWFSGEWVRGARAC